MTEPHRKPLAIYLGSPTRKRKHEGVCLTARDLTRFDDRVDQSAGPDACWPWLGATSGDGYGRMKVAGRLLSPHRIAWVTKRGNLVPDASYHGGVIMHRCDNPPCCNPSHLKLASQAENARDMAKKRRGVKPKPRHPAPFTPFCGRS